MYDSGMEKAEACGRCPKDDLKREKARLKNINAALVGYEAIRNVYVESINYKEGFAILGELMVKKADVKRNIKRLKAEIKQRKAKKEK